MDKNIVGFMNQGLCSKVAERLPHEKLQPGDTFQTEKEQNKPRDERHRYMKLDGQYQKSNDQNRGNSVIIAGPTDRGKIVNVPSDTPVLKE